MKFFVIFLFLASSFLNAVDAGCWEEKPHRFAMRRGGATVAFCYKDRSELPESIRHLA